MMSWRLCVMRSLRLVCVLLLACCCVTPAIAVPALQDVVMYEVNLRAFSQAGDLDGVTGRLDEIQALGVNVLWLMPIHPVGQVNSAGGLGSPYSVQNYGQIGGEYGSLSDLTALIDGAHQRGMSVLLDWVANHTAWDHPWITAHPDWYSQDGQGQIIHPPGTNWTDVADLNYNNQAMRSAMISEMQYWVTDVGIDGFRTDTADFVPFSFWQQAIPAVRASTTRPLLMLAEGARNDHYAAGFDLTYGWDFYNAVKSVFNSSAPATLLQQTQAAEFAVVPQGKGILQFTTNHDESAWDATPVELFGGLDASLAAYAVTIAYGGTPLVYSGQEIGWEDQIPFFTRDPLDWNTGQDTAQWYAQLLGARADHIALREGTLIDQSSNDVAVLMREYQDDQVLVLVNTRDQSRQAAIPSGWRGDWVDLITGQALSLSATHALAPYGVLILGTVPVLTGDINGDGFVGLADLNVILSNWNQTVPVGDKSRGDLAGIGDGFVGISDLNVVLSNWNAGTPPGTDTLNAVPEPAAALMLGSIGFILLAQRAK